MHPCNMNMNIGIAMAIDIDDQPTEFSPACRGPCTGRTANAGAIVSSKFKHSLSFDTNL